MRNLEKGILLSLIFLLSVSAIPSYASQKNNKVETDTVKVTVKESEDTVKSIELKDSTIAVGSTWKPENNFSKVILSNGKELAWKDVVSEINVTGDSGTGVPGQVVNTEKAGTYTVSYLYKGKTATAKVTVASEKIISSSDTKPYGKKILPHTGETNSSKLIILGFVLLLISGAYVLTLKRKKSN